MKREREILESFFRAIREGDERRFPNAGIYRKLIFYRFDDVLASTYPRFRARLSDKKWERLVHAYIATDVRTPYMWEMPREFVRFAPGFVGRRKAYLKDLLWYEWIEVELMMTPCGNKRRKRVKFSRAYRLTECARLKKLRYPVMLEEDPEPGEKGEYPLLVYKAPDGSINWRLLTPFLYKLLKRCDGKTPLKTLVCRLAKKYNIDDKEARKVLRKPLEEFLTQGILS